MTDPDPEPQTTADPVQKGGEYDALPFFPSSVVHLQKRGTVTFPPWVRQPTAGPITDRWWLRAGPDATLILMPLWHPEALFTRYDATWSADDPLPTSSALPRRWLDAETVLSAQHDPNHPARAWCQAVDDGFQSVQMDPVVLADLLDRLPRHLPHGTRTQWAQYVASICTWTGVTLTDRDFHLGVLALWSVSQASWTTLVQRARETQ